MMKQIIKKTNSRTISKLKYLFIVAAIISYISCEDNILPEAGSIPDLTPPEAGFVATQGAGPNDEWKTYTFANLSTGATMYSWSFGDGNTSTTFEPLNTFPGEGTFTVTLIASDNLGVESTYTEVIEVVQPIATVIPDPVLVNADFNKLPKSSGSDCSCSGWINKSLGDQGESSSGNGGSDNVVKFDNNEPDHVYQEFEVTPNADYTITVVSSFKDPLNGTYPSMLEIRVLAGSGYVSNYAPTYYTNTVDFPQDGYGYTTISQVEDPTNNLLTPIMPISNPSDTSYLTNTFTFNAGNNTSVAFFMRGIGGDSSVGNFGYTSGDEEIRVDSVTITAN
ncbi:PKD domain-containing protein [Flavobacteriaceae bacterium S356]|uniref:PKD domain-containing protein n=1 Tax=Asprobacillus argus TaxID=3076534 RepID=A0ABU3LCK9_9FLAO|nr:PKD domain-containing protein [Flavobacteriaceae bacterium S356]